MTTSDVFRPEPRKEEIMGDLVVVPLEEFEPLFVQFKYKIGVNDDEMAYQAIMNNESGAYSYWKALGKAPQLAIRAANYLLHQER